MEFVIGAIAVVLVLLVIAFLKRKNIHKEIDYLEKKKLELMQRPVNEELAKVKRLNMTGQTEELFENWRYQWDELVTTDLASIDEKLYQSEEWLDKLRFGKAKETNQEIHEQLSAAEERIDAIVNELHELMGSEEQNRTESEELKDKQKLARKRLLAHRHTFGRSASTLESQLDALTGQFAKFEEMTQEGNYLRARETILKLQEDMDQILHKMERIPALLSEVTALLPSQLDDIEGGYKEMRQQGYLLDHLQIPKEVRSIREQLAAYQEYVSKAEIEEVEEGIGEIRDSIDFFYDLLEKEVESKHYLLQNNDQAKEIIREMMDENADLQAETQTVQQSYQLAKEEWNVPNKLEEEINAIDRKYIILEQKVIEQKTAYSFLNEELKEIYGQLEELKKEQRSFTEFLQTLRKDEMEAREQLADLRKRTNDVFRMIKKSNLPGVPEFYKELSEEAAYRIDEVVQCLNEKPLTMKVVQEKLKEAVRALAHLEKKTQEVIDQAELAEKIIQYGNRYRRTHPDIAAQLEKAEQAFRNYDYRTALEQSATAIDKVDPKGLKELEDMMNNK